MASVEGLAKVGALVNQGAQQAQQFNREEVAKKAAQLFQSGDIKGAYAAMAAADPDHATQSFNQFQQLDPSSQGALQQAETVGQLEGQTAFGVNPRQMLERSLESREEAAKAKPQSGRGEEVFQVRDPLTDQVLLIKRGSGEVVKTLGSPQKLLQEDPEADPKDFDPKELFKSLNPKQRKTYDTIQKDFMKDTADDRQAFVAAAKVQALLKGGKEIGNDIIRAVQNQLSTATGDRGSRTEMDVKPFGGRASVINRLERAISANASGKLPEGDRQFLLELSDVMANSNKQAVITRSSPFASQLATRSSLTEDQSRNLLLQGLVDDASKENVPASDEKVRVISPDGKSGMIPKANLQKALQKGFKQAP